MTAVVSSASSRARQRKWSTLVGLLGAPLAWFVVIYLGSLVALLVTSLYRVDDFAGIIHEAGAQNFRKLASVAVYRAVSFRTLGIAFAVTIIDLTLAVPIAFYLAKVATPRKRRILAVLITLPLWASYLVKAYAWRIFLDPGGLLHNLFGVTPGFGIPAIIIVLSYLWLPYAILPIYAGLERLPNSLLEASADLGGRSRSTFSMVVLPMLFPALLAASIFTFSLSLGDYITVNIVGGATQMLGNVINAQYTTDLPFSAAMTFIPIVIMIVYLLGVRKTGALENL